MELDPKDFPNQEIPPELTMKVKEKKGCFYYGCITAVVLSLIAIVSIYIGVNYAVKTMREYVENYTESSPIEFEEDKLSYEEFQVIRGKLKNFFSSLESGTLTESEKQIKISVDQINSLIAREKELEEFRDKLRIDIQNGKLIGKVSLDLGELGIPGLKGKYINGKGRFKIGIEKGELIVIPEDLKVGGKDLPEALRNGIKNKNIATNTNEKSKNKKLINKLSRIEIEDNMIVIEAK